VAGLIGFVATRLVTLALAAFWNAGSAAALIDHLTKGDGNWYLDVAESGYDHWPAGRPVINGLQQGSNLAFFPLLPALIRALSAIGLSPATAGLTITAIASLIAAWGLVRFGERVATPQVGILLAILWGVLPGSVVLSMVLSEALFTALAVWVIVHLLRDNLMTAAVLTAVAGLSRSTAIALVAAVLWVAIPLLRDRTQRPRAISAIVVAPLGLIAYLGWVTLRVGKLDGYLVVQKQWNSGFDFGVSLARSVVSHLTTDILIPDTIVSLTIIAALILLAFLIRQRPPAPVLVYTVVVLLLILGQTNYLNSRQRFLVVVFPLLLPLARGLMRCPMWVRVVLIAVAGGLSAFYGAWLLNVWPRSV
jgi:hypothetical protein